MKPVVKWVGGKSGNLKSIVELLPSAFGKYYEPFFGGGALYFELLPALSVINDKNTELINMYIQIRDKPDTVVDILSNLDDLHESSLDASTYYYKVREQFNSTLGSNTPEQGARFIYLNKHCFNGLFRVNSKGLFNTPFNGKLSGKSFDIDNIFAVSKQLACTTIKSEDFETVLNDVESSDFVFLDSPYTSLTATSFLDYTKDGFSYEDHVRVAELFKKLSNQGVYCMTTNHDTALVRGLYKEYNIKLIDVRRSINTKGDNRKGKEVIITNYNN